MLLLVSWAMTEFLNPEHDPATSAALEAAYDRLKGSDEAGC
jgi:hypothetical protein